MKRYIMAIIACLIAQSAYAQQQRIRDLSLSPEETFRLPDAPSAPTGNYPGYQQQPYPTDPVQQRISENPYGDNSVTQSSSFMTGYCNPNFKPLIANAPGLSGLQSCLEAQKQQACGAFQALPADAARLLDDTIGCLSAAAEANMPTGQLTNDAGCATNDSARLQLLKKYWRDPSIAYALVFLPDEVLNASGKCLQGGK